MLMYHEVKPEQAERILREGINLGETGSKTDAMIAKTDQLIDEMIPDSLKAKGLNRQSNIYGYLALDDEVIDITDGSQRSVKWLQRKNGTELLAVTVNSAQSYVSDIDAYDAVKSAISRKANDAEISELIDRYWSRVIPLTDFLTGQFSRPEVMVTYDIKPENIRRI